jgi:hypothetical protein
MTKMPNQTHALDAGLHLYFIRASLARASDVRRSAEQPVLSNTQFTKSPAVK